MSIKGSGTIKFLLNMENSMDNIIGFRYEATGVFGYEFYRDKEKLCAVSSMVVPSPPVTISGYGRTLECEGARIAPVLPGTTRCIYDYESKRKVATVAYKDFENYVINNFYNVRCDSQGYKVICQGEVIVEIKRFEGKPSWYPDSLYYDYEAYFEVSMSRDLDNVNKMLVMAFPMIRFGVRYH